ncbi:MAG: DNA adenine methyltransferase YhdJ [Bacteroidetes bacterium ADurb.Bin141]|nr:MAG: DNA adenine methyltransferase YhdJ [Bacteroidetes bacterium ADurb.Bin141]
MELNKIYCGDNVTVMKQMPDECVDLTVTSPPYDNLRTYGGHEWDFEAVARELFRLTKQGGVVVWVVGDSVVDGSETGNSFRQALFFKDVGFKLHDTMIYWKNSFAFPEQNRYAQNFEYMFVFCKGKIKTAHIFKLPTNIENRIKTKNSNYRTVTGETLPMKYETGKDERNKENIWIYECGFSKTTNDTYAFKHPAMFPEAMVGDHILSWSNEGDTVLDPFSGSGTTCKMAQLHGRKYVGIEINPEYIEISNKRLAQGVLDFAS